MYSIDKEIGILMSVFIFSNFIKNLFPNPKRRASEAARHRCCWEKVFWKYATGEYPCRSAISIKLQSNFIKITLRHECSHVNLLHIFRTLFSKNTYGELLLERVGPQLVRRINRISAVRPIFRKSVTAIFCKCRCISNKLKGIAYLIKIRLSYHWLISYGITVLKQTTELTFLRRPDKDVSWNPISLKGRLLSGNLS